MDTITVVLVILVAVVMSGFVGRMLPRPVPLPLLQIALGALISLFSPWNTPLNPEIFFLLFLPPLLFLDGWRIPKHSLMKDKWTILELALGLVIFTVVGMGFLIHWMIPAMPLAVAFALAAVLSPTDPVAVASIASRLHIPKRLIHILEGESLLNDASGLVCLRFAVAAALVGTFSLPEATLTFFWLAVGGICSGILVTLIITQLKGFIAQKVGEETGTQILVSLLIPFAAYLTAEHIHASGILAAVAAGITMSYAEIQGGTRAVTRVRRNVVWDTLQFTANGAIFVLLGEQMPRISQGAVQLVRETGHHDAWWLGLYVVLITLGLAVLRFGWVWTSIRFTIFTKRNRKGFEETKPKVPLRLVGVFTLGGVRGAITLAGILTLPIVMNDGSLFPARDLAIFLAAGVIILSMLLATIFLPLIAKGMHFPEEETTHKRDEEIARVAAATAAISAVEKAMHELSAGRSDADLYAGAAARVMGIYRNRVEQSLKTGEAKEQTALVNKLERKLRIIGLNAEREEIFRLGRHRHIPDDLVRRLVRELDMLEARDGDQH